jgi:pseudouridine synthase
MKLLLFLSHNGVLSRRKSFEAIMAGSVRVNGHPVSEPSFEIDPDKDKVEFRHVEVRAKKLDYILLNKPAGYVTTCEGQFDQRTVMQLLPRDLQHVKPVGRLDKETEGLLLLTNDGELANRLAHPRFDVDKTYFVRMRWRFTEKAAQRLEEGIKMEGEMTAPAKVKVLRVDQRESEIEITIHEGKKHQVRLMMNLVGCPVIYLRRLRQGPLSLGNLRSAAWRRLTDAEIKSLQEIRYLPPRVQERPKSRPMLVKRYSQHSKPSHATDNRSPETNRVEGARPYPKTMFKRNPFNKDKRSKGSSVRPSLRPRPSSLDLPE